MRLKLILVALGLAFLLITGFRPGALPFHPGAPFSDAVTSHLPAAQFLRESVLQNGVFPLWRETIMAGQPFAADPLNKTAYPLQWLALLLPPALHLDLMILLHLLIAGAGMWVWARSLNLNEPAAAVAAFSYAFAPRMIGHLGAGHLDLIYAMAWFPWLMWSVGQIIHAQNSFLGARYIVPLRRMLLVALFGALVFLADVRLALFAYALAAAYALYVLFYCKRPLRFFYVLPAALLVAILTLSVTLPLLGWSPYLSRAALTAQDAGVFSLSPVQLVLGSVMLVSPSVSSVETMTYLGIPMLMLAIAGAYAYRHWFWMGVIVVAALYALGVNTPFWRVLVDTVPALLWFRVPSRAWFVVTLVASLLAGYAIQSVVYNLSITRRYRLVSLIGVVVFVILGIGIMRNAPNVNGFALAVGGCGISLIALLGAEGRIKGRQVAWAFLLLIFVDMALVGRGWLEWRAQDAWLPPAQVRLAERLSELNANRIYSPTYSLQQQVAEEYHLRLFGGVDPFQLTGIVEAVEQGGGIDHTGYSVVLPPITGADLATSNRGAEPDATLLGQWGVTHVVSAYPIDATGLFQVDEIDGVYIYENMSAALIPRRDWLPGWDDLPDAATVAALFNRTQTAALISGVSFVGVVIVLVGMFVSSALKAKPKR